MNQLQRRTHLGIWMALAITLPTLLVLAVEDKPEYLRIDEIELIQHYVDILYQYRTDSVILFIRSSDYGTVQVAIKQEIPLNTPGLAVFVSLDGSLEPKGYLGLLGSNYLEYFAVPPDDWPFFKRVILYSIIEDRIIMDMEFF